MREVRCMTGHTPGENEMEGGELCRNKTQSFHGERRKEELSTETMTIITNMSCRRTNNTHILPLRVNKKRKWKTDAKECNSSWQKEQTGRVGGFRKKG